MRGPLDIHRRLLADCIRHKIVRLARRADSGETSAATEYSHALVSPLALTESLPVLLDADLAVATRSRVGTISKVERPREPARVFDRFATAGA